MQIANVQTIIKKRTILKKKIVIPLLVLVLITGGFFWWWKGDEITRIIERKQMIRESPFSPPEEYALKDVQGGKLIENKKQGFRAVARPEWSVEIVEDPYWVTGVVFVLSPDVQFNPQIRSRFDPLMHLLMKGCKINVKIMKDSEDTIYKADYIREKINEIKQSPGGFIESESNGIILQDEKIGGGALHRQESIEIDSHEALKQTIYYTQEIKDKSGLDQEIMVKIPVKNKVYFLETPLLQENKERCQEAFDEFLNTVSIK